MDNFFTFIQDRAFLIGIGFSLINLILFLTYAGVFWRKIWDLKKIFRGVSGQDIRQILDKNFQQVAKASQRLDEQNKILGKIGDELKLSLQKVGFIRFNPYKETGGDQSFVLALLDQNDDGVVISSLHGRNQTRVFAKKVSRGKPDGHVFSDEEQRSIDQAQSRKALKKG